MAPLLFRGMKGVNISCASPASTATCRSVDPRRSVAGRHSTASAMDQIDRQSAHLRDAHRARSLKNWVVPPSPSKLKSYVQKSRKSTADVPGSLVSPASSSRYLLDGIDDDTFFDVFPDLDPLPVLIPINSARFQSVAGDESPALRPSCSSSSSFAASRDQQVCFRAPSSSSSAPPTPFQVAKRDVSVAALGPSASSDYGEHLRAAAAAALLPSTGPQIVRVDALPVRGPPPSLRSQSQDFLRSSSSLSQTRLHSISKIDEPAVLKASSSARARVDQVVVLRVSLHCKGCEAKVKRHISRMQGVTSFSVDFAAKKVTVIGDVTPLSVLSSISKVKNAQFWPPAPRPSASSC